MRKLCGLVLAAFAAMGVGVSIVAGPAVGQAYPSKPIKVIVPFGAGSGTDSVARIVTQAMSKSMGQPLVVVNKPGADGSIAGIETVRSPADGYSIMLATNSPLAVAPLLRKVAPYDPIADFTAISFVGDFSFFVVVHPTVPAKTLVELVAYAKANPGKLNYATGNTTGIVFTGLLAQGAGITMQQIPYKTEPEAIPDLLSGQVDLMISSYSTVGPHIGVGKLRALATTLVSRNPLLPDVPSIVEAGQPKFPVGPWSAFVGPAKLPSEIVERLNKEAVAALAQADVSEQLQKMGVVPRSSTPAEFADQLKAEIPVWQKALKEAGIEQQ